MPSDLKEMHDHFHNFLTALLQKDEVKSYKDIEDSQLFNQFESQMSKQNDKWTGKVNVDIKIL